VAKAIVQIGKLGMFEQLHDLNVRTFKHPHTVQLFDRYATYNGSNPYQTSALYSMIPSFEHGQGAYFPTKGLVSIGQSLLQLAQDIGVEVTTSTRVDKVVMDKTVVKGVEAMGNFWPANAIVSNADVTHLYRDLMPDLEAPDKVLAQPLSTSALVFYWGVQGVFPELGLHNIFFSSDYKKEFEELFETEQWPEEPSIYINITSKHKPDDAPIGCENWFVMVNLPPRLDLDTEESQMAMRKKVLTILTKRLGRDIEPLIQIENFLSPTRIKEQTSGWQGALYGSNSNSLFSGFWRHPNFSDKLKGMFFTGGTVHPGGGIPLALKSGQIAAGLAADYLN
jgi:phytoene desaturase